MDPVDYNKVRVVWFGAFFFTGLAFGLLDCQRVTGDTVSWILCWLGLEMDKESANYVDDTGGVESTQEQATAAFETLGWLLADFGLAESTEKAEPPASWITYLRVQFDSIAMEMRVPPGNLQKIKSEIRLWLRRTAITKKELQSLLGKLFWVGKLVKHSPVFHGECWSSLGQCAACRTTRRQSRWTRPAWTRKFNKYRNNFIPSKS